MDQVAAVVRDPHWGLLSPLWFTVLVALALVAVFSERVMVRVAVAIVIVITVGYRENLFYTVVRLVIDRDMSGTANGAFVDGIREMAAFAKATRLYSVGCATLLAIIAVWRPRGVWPPTRIR